MDIVWRWQWMKLIGSIQLWLSFLFLKTWCFIYNIYDKLILKEKLSGMTHNGIRWDLPSESLNPPCLLKQVFETDFVLSISISKVIVPMCSYRLSCSSVSYKNGPVENGRGERQARKEHHHRYFLEPSCKVQVSWGLISFYIIVSKLITRTNKNPRSYYLMYLFY